MADLKFSAATVTLALALALAVACARVAAHTHMTTPVARGDDDSGNTRENPCGGFNSTGTDVHDFDIRAGAVTISIGHGDKGDVFMRYFKRGDASGVVAQGVPNNARDPAAWTQVGYYNVTVNPPQTQTFTVSIADAIATAKVGDIGVLQMAMDVRNDDDEWYQCADIRLVSAAPTALITTASAVFVTAAAALLGLALTATAQF